MVIPKNLKNYLKNFEIQSLIEYGDFNSLYDDFNIKFSHLATRDLTRILYLAGIDPLLNQIGVPDYFLYGSIALNQEDQELKQLFKNFHIPEGIEAIGYCSFKFCKGIETINLPSTLKFIDEEGLRAASDLKRIYYNGTYEEWQKVTKANEWTSIYDSKLNIDKYLICKDKVIKMDTKRSLK